MDFKEKLIEWKKGTDKIEALKLQGKQTEAEERYAELIRKAWSSVKLDERDGFSIGDWSLPVEDYILFQTMGDRRRRENQQIRPYQFKFGLQIPKDSRLDRQQIVNESWKAAQSSDLSKLNGSINYTLRWSPKDFQKAIRFPGGLSGKVEIEASQSLVQLSDETNSVFGPDFARHTVTAETEGKVMKVGATGLYRGHLGEIVAAIAPQTATLVLTSEDVERLLRKEKKGRSSFSFSQLERALVPMESFSASIGAGGLTISPNRTIELTVSARDLGYWEEILCKPLASVSPHHASGIKYFQKNYGLIALWKGERLRDAQDLAERLEDIDLGVVNYDPQINGFEAKELLGRHLERTKQLALKDKSWVPPENLQGLLNKYCGSAFARRIGTINSTSDELTRVLSLLREKGYEGSEQIPEGQWWAYKPGVHVVEFLRQQHAKDPSSAIDAVRNEYRNRNYGARVMARIKGVPLAKIREIVLPEEALLHEFNITEWQGNGSSRFESNSYNLLYVHTGMFSKETVIRCSADLARPALLGPQETALRMAGLVIN